jgi:hypothetical protein
LAGTRVILLLAAALAACSAQAPTVIDGTSPASFATTADRARQDLPAGDRLDFDRALATLPARRHSAEDPEALKRITLHGMTAQEVVEDFRARQR